MRIRSLFITTILIIFNIYAFSSTAFSQTSGNTAASDTGRRGSLTIDYKKKINLLKKAEDYFKQGNITEAEYYVHYALNNGFDKYDCYILLADIYKAQNKSKAEAGALTNAIEHSPNERLRDESAKRRDVIFAELKRKKIKEAAEIVALDTQNPSKVTKLGNIFLETSEPDKAMIQYNYANSLQKKSKSGKYGLIKMYLKQNRLNEAKKLLKEYFELAPADTGTVYLLASYGININEAKDLGYNGQGNFDRRKYNKTYAEYYFKNGYMQYLKENYESAKHSMDYALQYYTTHSRAHKYLGEIYYSQGMFSEASHHLRIAFEYYPTDYEIGLKAAKALLFSNDKEKSRIYLESLLKIDCTNKTYAELLLKSGLRMYDIENMGYVNPDKPPVKKRRPKSVNTDKNKKNKNEVKSIFELNSPLSAPGSGGQQQLLPYSVSPTGGTSYPQPAENK
ncbi:MAG: hypothetical protein QMC67_15880 [Candidatus Wallbacteria bacterium]